MMSNYNLITALITPFNKENKIDIPSLFELIDVQLQNNINEFILFGTTGEGSTISLKEKIKTIKSLRKKYKSKIKLIVGISEASTKKCIENVEVLSKYKIDAFLVLTPHYLKTNEEGLYLHFISIANASLVPIYIYYIPKRTGQYMGIETINKLKNHSKIIGIKISASHKFLLECNKLKSYGFKIYSGDDLSLFESMKMKNDGMISVVSNLYPKTLKKVIKYIDENNENTATKLFEEFKDIFECLFEEPNPIPIKYLYSQIHNKELVYRLPLTNPSEVLIRKINSRYKEDKICELF